MYRYTFCVDFNLRNQKTKKPHETGFPKLGFISSLSITNAGVLVV